MSFSSTPRFFLILTEDITDMISVKISHDGQTIDKVEGDVSECPFVKEGVKWMAARAKLTEDGLKVIPNSWEAKRIEISEEKDLANPEQMLFRVSVKNAKHPIAGKFSCSVTHANLSDAKRIFWRKWTDDVKSTGAHTHLMTADGYQRV